MIKTKIEYHKKTCTLFIFDDNKLISTVNGIKKDTVKWKTDNIVDSILHKGE